MKVELLPTADLRACPLILRPVDRTTIEFYQLKQSIQSVGLLQPLLVRPDNEVVDGLHRLFALRELRQEQAPCLVRELTDGEVLRVQVIANEVRNPSALPDLSRRLADIIKRGDMTINELAHSLSRSRQWVANVLNLDRLCKAAATALEKNEINLEQAVDLAKLPAKLQVEHLRDSPQQIRSRVRLLRSEATIQRLSDKYEGTPPAYRRFSEVCNEIETPTAAGPALVIDKAETPLDGWQAAIRWVLQLDNISLRKRKRTQ